MRVVSWNLHGGSPGKATDEQQHRSWALMRDKGADLILAQEASAGGIPEWVKKEDEWKLLQGEVGRFRKKKRFNWGSVIAARSGLRLRSAPYLEWPPDLWVAHLYDMVLVGQIDLPGSRPALVASVHTAAQPVSDWIRKNHLREYPKIPFPLADEEIVMLQRPTTTEDPYINDFAFTALDRIVKRGVERGRFIIAGDWNTCRKYEGGPEFFLRAKAHEWVECHREPEEPSYFPNGTGVYQLDHAFCDQATEASIRSCHIMVCDPVLELSDHAPLVIDFDDAE